MVSHMAWKCEAGETAQSMKGLPCRHENLSVMPGALIKSGGVHTWSPMAGKVETEESQGLAGELQFSERLHLEKARWRVMAGVGGGRESDIDLWPPHLSTHRTRTDTNTQNKKKKMG